MNAPTPAQSVLKTSADRHSTHVVNNQAAMPTGFNAFDDDTDPKAAIERAEASVVRKSAGTALIKSILTSSAVSVGQKPSRFRQARPEASHRVAGSRSPFPATPAACPA